MDENSNNSQQHPASLSNIRAQNLTREELLAINQSLFEEMNAMELQHEQTLTAAVDALEKNARERRALERQISDLTASKNLIQQEKNHLERVQESLRSDLEEMKTAVQHVSEKAIFALKDRETMTLQMITIEAQVAKLLDWLIEEGRVLEKQDCEENISYCDDCDRDDYSHEKHEDKGFLNYKDAENRQSQFLRPAATAIASFSCGFNKKGVDSSRLGASSSLTTLYANAIANAGTITTQSSRNKLITSSCNSSASSSRSSLSVAEATCLDEKRKNSSVSHLRLSVSSLSKRSSSNNGGELRPGSALTNLNERIMGQIGQIAELLKAVLSLQEETGRQLWEAKKRVKSVEVEVSMLRKWRDVVMKRVDDFGNGCVRSVSVGLRIETDEQDALEITRELSKRLTAVSAIRKSSGSLYG
ncbi:hypothetical protein HK100_001698 [Physocladia obscura]|uniref:Uncharacterized protein n=1 Tax=Physocladia obscura TaxID=109957 RepID=A0AAD5SWQ9_9FUNG|nr:hypothetical protein HK100_001698 [Physocladia obscura]